MRHSIFDWFRPRTAYAQQALDRFVADYDAYSEMIACVALKILVWGPTIKSSSPVAQKRRDIRDALLAEGHVALFSESVPALDHGLSLRSRELAQAFAADMLIVLPEDSQGAMAEAEGLCSHPDLAPKAFILAPRQYKDGYSGRGIFLLLETGYGAVHWYSDVELSRCDVLHKALERARARREILASHLLRTRTLI